MKFNAPIRRNAFYGLFNNECNFFFRMGNTSSNSKCTLNGIQKLKKWNALRVLGKDCTQIVKKERKKNTIGILS